MRILLIEKDLHLGHQLKHGLGGYHNAVDWVTDGLAAKQALMNESFDVIVLDLMLPDMPGFDFLRQLRNNGFNTPILILTASNAVEDKILGLDAGADDYLAIPFELEEVAARIRALHRRNYGMAKNTIERADLILDVASHRVTKGDLLFNLPRREFALLQKLLENQGRVIDRDGLSQAIYGWDNEVDSNALEVHIHNLRKKLGEDLIRTLRGVGYMIEKI